MVMIISQILICVIGFIIGYFILYGLNSLIFSKSKVTFKRHIQVVSFLASALYAVACGYLIFVAEGEGEGTGLDQGVGTFLAVLPLFLYFYLIFFAFTALPLGIIATMITISIAEKSKARKSK